MQGRRRDCGAGLALCASLVCVIVLFIMADTLPWIDEAAAKDAISAVRKDDNPTDWYVPGLLCSIFSLPLFPPFFHSYCCHMRLLAYNNVFSSRLVSRTCCSSGHWTVIGLTTFVCCFL